MSAGIADELPLAALASKADAVCREVYGNAVYLRGLVETTNYCVMDCAYCGIRRSNATVVRYRMSESEIADIVGRGLKRGLKSFVLQGGEDPEFGAEKLARLADKLRLTYGCAFAITMSFGTFPKASYKLMRSAGADRYLLRFETADADLHQRLRGTRLAQRLAALEALKELGFEVGTGFMTGLPGDRLAGNLELLKKLQPDMVGIGPFIPHAATPLANEKGSALEPVVRAVAMTRLMLPEANIPASTAAGSVAPSGRELVLAAGANVLMPNIGTIAYKKLYELYPGKICIDEDGFSCMGCLEKRAGSIGKELNFGRGDSISWRKRNAENCAQ
mgnify:CR=1 FL=1